MKPLSIASRPAVPLAMASVVAALVAACGGGAELFALPFVGSIGGNWSGPLLADGRLSNTQTELVNPDGAAQVDARLFGGPNQSYSVFLQTAGPNNCGATAAQAVQVTMQMSGADFAFSVPNDPSRANCLRGRIVDEVTMELANGSRLTNFLGFQPRFHIGVWSNPNNRNQRLVFRNDAVTNAGVTTQTGCEYDGANRVGSVEMRWRGATFANVNNPATRLAIESIRLQRAASTDTWTGGRMVGASGIELNGGVLLERQNQTLACP